MALKIRIAPFPQYFFCGGSKTFGFAKHLQQTRRLG